MTLGAHATGEQVVHQPAFDLAQFGEDALCRALSPFWFWHINPTLKVGGYLNQKLARVVVVNDAFVVQTPYDQAGMAL